MDKTRVTWKVDMFDRVKVVCDNHITIINDTPALSDSYTNFNNRLIIVKDQMEPLTIEDNGLVGTRDLAWTNLAASLKGITAGLRAYAKKTNNLILLAQAKYTKSAFTQDRGTEAIALANQLLELAQANIANLASYNVSPAKMTAANGYLAELTTYNPQPTTQRSSNKALRQLLVKGIVEISKLLKNEMDELVRTLEDEEAVFYGEYFAARRIIRTGIRHKKVLTEAVAAAKQQQEAETPEEENKTIEAKEASPPEANPAAEGKADANGTSKPAESSENEG